MNKKIKIVLCTLVVVGVATCGIGSLRIATMQRKKVIKAENFVTCAQAFEIPKVKRIKKSTKKELTHQEEVYEITAYCGCEKCCGKSNKITASGATAAEGVTAAADESIPFGTKVVIDGVTYTVQDRGGVISGNRIDIYFESHSKALQHGRQTKKVVILKGE